MDTTYKNITSFFEETLNDLQCGQDTTAYIISIFVKYKSAQFDLSKDSVTEQFCQARQNQNFLIYQNLGDWLFYTMTWAPAHLKFASKDYYDTIARLSYYSCYKITKNQWHCYEELADNLLFLEEQVKNKLSIISNTQISLGKNISLFD
jgi:hypothetical protein